jgi:hypothetical protein
MRAAWLDVYDELMPIWVAEHPFTRPLCFWLFDATAPRVRVVGEQRIESEQWARERGADFRRSYFERLNERLGYPSTQWPETGEYESEKQYLCRLGLLFDSERELL